MRLFQMLPRPGLPRARYNSRQVTGDSMNMRRSEDPHSSELTRRLPAMLSNTPHYVRLFLLIAILSVCVGCDQMTKSIARDQLANQHVPLSYLSDTVRLQYAENPGAFLGLGGSLPPQARWLLLVVVNTIVAVGIGVFVLFQTSMSPLKTLACALLLGGAIGNLIDRLRFDGLVIDFMNLGIGPLRTGIFNVADVAITTGALLLILPQLAPAKAKDVVRDATT